MTLRTTVAAMAVVLLATAFTCLAAARPEVRGLQWSADIADMAEDGRYVIHWRAPGREAPVAAIRGNLSESPEAVEAFAELLQPSASSKTPGQAAQECLDAEMVTCCGSATACENYCWVDITIDCTNPDGTGGCVVQCFSPGCKDDNCGWFWCECPPLPSAVDES